MRLIFECSECKKSEETEYFPEEPFYAHLPNGFFIKGMSMGRKFVAADTPVVCIDCIIEWHRHFSRENRD